jgi:organic radical activating enzyme
MVDAVREIPFLTNVGMVITYRCQVACPHCIIEAGPNRGERINTEDAFDWIRQIAGYRDGHVQVLSLTGGEPFIDLDIVRLVSGFAADVGLSVSAVTNAFWASNEREATAILRSLPALEFVSVSADLYHQSVIPLDRVRIAVNALKQLDVPYSVSLCVTRFDDPNTQQFLQTLYEFTGPETIDTAVMFPVGRAARHIDLTSYRTSPYPSVAACPIASSPLILPDGRVLACVGPVIDLKGEHPLLLGDLHRESVATIFDRAERNTILHAIRVWGPRKIISLLQAAGLGAILPTSYLEDSPCSPCYSLMRNPEIIECMRRIEADSAFESKVQYARAYYLGEVAPFLH